MRQGIPSSPLCLPPLAFPSMMVRRQQGRETCRDTDRLGKNNPSETGVYL